MFLFKAIQLVGLSFRMYQGPHNRTHKRARKGHSRLLKGANEQKNSANKLLFPNRLAQHALKLLSSQPVLVCNKYLLVTLDVFLLQNNAFKRTVCTVLL